MKRLALTVLLGLASLASGCKTTGHVSGRLDEILPTEITRYGGHAITIPSESVYAANGEWTIKRDRFGVVLQASDVDFEQVDGFLREVYGTPSKGGKTGEHQQQWVIPAKVAGVSIWYAKMENGGVQVTVLKPLNVP
jgi:hypothetical protein